MAGNGKTRDAENMKLGEDLIKKLQKKYEPSAMVHMQYRGKDLAFKTDKEGNPVQLFIGRKNEQDVIIGHRYSRTLQFYKNGMVLKDHWDLKGKSS